MDRGAWWATVHGTAKESDMTKHSCTYTWSWETAVYILIWFHTSHRQKRMLFLGSMHTMIYFFCFWFFFFPHRLFERKQNKMLNSFEKPRKSPAGMLVHLFSPHIGPETPWCSASCRHKGFEQIACSKLQPQRQPQNFIILLGNYFPHICFDDDRPFSILLFLLLRRIEM